MHDLIQKLGWERVRQECREEPGKRSRLGLPNKILHVFDRNKGTSAVQSIFLQRPTKDNVVHSINDSFSNMDRLRLLKIWNVEFSGNIKYLSNELQFLDWHECPLISLPSDFQPENLVELHMYSSRIEQLWRGGRGWGMLRLMDLRGSQYLISTPDFSEVPVLEISVLADCTSLVEVHPSLGFLKKLFFLNMRNCKSVESIPPLISLESLKTLNLSLCSRLKKFPEIEGNMKSLLEIYLGETAIEELPPSVERLTGLTMLSLRDCKHLLHLPGTIQCLTSLKILILIGCSKLDKMLENLNCLECLEELYIDGTAIKELSFLVGMKNLRYLSCEGCKGLHHAPMSLLLPASLSSLSCLVQLDLSDCNLMDGAIPNDLSSLISLEILDLNGNNFLQLPESISQLLKLLTLNLNNCRQLQLLPKLPSSCRYVNARGCPSLMGSSNQFKVLTSIESGALNSLSSTSAFGDSESFKGWSFSTDAQGSCDMRVGMRADEHSEWKQVDYLSVPVTTLLKDIELSDDLSNSINAVFADNEIPEWFSSVTTNNTISILIPPNLTDDNKWKGVAACAVFSFKGLSAISLVEPDSKSSSYFNQCAVETDVFSMEPSIFDWEELRVVRSSSHILLIFYLASCELETWLDQSTVMAARFETNNPFMEVEKCGIRLVYEQDAGWFAKLFPGGIPIYLNDVQDATLKPGWLSQVDKCLKWEKFIPPCEQVCTILLRKNLESVLPRYLEALNHNSAMYKFHLRESPAWFESFNSTDTSMTEKNSTDTRPGSSISIKLPQNLHKSKKWMGFAIYASIAGEQLQKIQEEYRVYFQLKLGECYKDLSQQFKYIASEEHHQLLVVHIPQAQIPLQNSG